MCGIVGILQQDGRRVYSADDVSRMAERILHRGPDDQGIHDGHEVLLGMRRLSIIDVDGGHQPVYNEDRTICVVNNGEIYNFRALRDELLKAGHTFYSHSDTEVLVHLYEELGEKFLERLEGMFALALWDSRRRKLIIARDRLGIKPLYLWRFAGGFAFASEIKAFQALHGFSVSASNDALFDYLSIGYAVAPRTVFQGVEKLAHAECLIRDTDGERRVRYWAPPDSVNEGPTYQDWMLELRSEMQRAVSDHMVSDVPVGAFLSGGIDSSAVTALMVQTQGSGLSTYSIGYSGSRTAEYYNELQYASAVAEHLGTRHHEINVQPQVVTLLPKLIWHLEEPISDSAITTTYLVSQLASESVKVILSGVGGDELFAGYNRYLGDYYQRKFQKIPRWLREVVFPPVAGLLPSGRDNRLMDMSRYMKRFIEAGKLNWRQRYQSYLSIADDDLVRRLVPAVCPDRTGLAAVCDLEAGADELLRLLRVDISTQLSENLLLLTDKMSMACSLECRVPFLDHGLVEMAARIPARHKLPNGNLKGLLKDAMRDVLPRSVIERRKRGFGAPVGAWFKKELAPLRYELLQGDQATRRGLVDADVVGEICRRHDRNREDYTDLILVLMNLELWARLFIDDRTYEDVASELAERSLAA